MLTGYVHPGLAIIIDNALVYWNILGIFGGFHDSREFEKLSGLEIIVVGYLLLTKKN